MKTLVLYTHPAQPLSRVNRVQAETARQVAGVTFADLYAEYPASRSTSTTNSSTRATMMPSCSSFH